MHANDNQCLFICIAPRQKNENQNNNAHARNVDTVMEYNIGFSFFKKFDKVVNTFVNARDMHAFPTIRNKIQVKDDNNYLSIGKRFDKSSESERKEAHEKASLEHEQSKDKPEIFLDDNPKDVDEIIKAMTPEI